MYCITSNIDCASSFNDSIFHNVGKNIFMKQRYSKFKKIKWILNTDYKNRKKTKMQKRIVNIFIDNFS